MLLQVSVTNRCGCSPPSGDDFDDSADDDSVVDCVWLDMS